MLKKDKQEIQGALIRKKQKLEKDLFELKELVHPEAPDSAIGRVSRMDAINNRSINEAAIRKKQIQLAKINEALKGVDDVNFGVCIKCGKTIQPGRIVLMPESKVCINCAR